LVGSLEEENMKSLFMLLIGMSVISSPARASGCMGGDPPTIEEQSLPPVKILTGEAKVDVQTYNDPTWKTTYSWITFSNVGTGTDNLIFKSQNFDPTVVDPSVVLAKLAQLRPSVMASAKQTISTIDNDGCDDPPSAAILTTYTFVVQLSDGAKWEFIACDGAYAR
jgi:hypothetical protein